MRIDLPRGLDRQGPHGGASRGYCRGLVLESGVRLSREEARMHPMHTRPVREYGLFVPRQHFFNFPVYRIARAAVIRHNYCHVATIEKDRQIGAYAREPS